MNKTAITILIACMCLVSCTEYVREGHDHIPGFMSISISAEDTKASLGEDMRMKWLKTDEIVVFNDDNKGIRFTTGEDRVSKAIFKTNEWISGIPTFVSVSGISSDEAVCTPEGILAVRLNNEQTASSTGQFGSRDFAAVGKVVETDGIYSVPGMKNVIGLLKLYVPTSNYRSISVEAPGGECVAGYVDVDYSRLLEGGNDFWRASEGREQYSSITLRPSGSALDQDGCFAVGCYYVSLLPQDYSAGLKICFHLRSGDTVEQRLGADEGVTINRSAIKYFGEDYSSILPDEIVIDLNFYNEGNVNPFGSFPLSKNQVVEGEDYIYQVNFEKNGESRTIDAPFRICKGPEDGKYYYDKQTTGCGITGRKVLYMNKVGGYMKLPGFTGMALSSVTYAQGSITSAKQIQIRPDCSKTDNIGATSNIPRATAEGPEVQTLDVFEKAQAGVSYYIYWNSASNQVYDIKLVWKKK